MRRALRAVCCLLPWLAACQGFVPVRMATRQRLQPMSLATMVARGTFLLELESAVMSGTYDVLWARQDDGSLRLQLFPDVGGKVLDLRCSSHQIRAETPVGDYVAEPPLHEAPPHLALVLAMLLSELTAPVPERLLEERLLADEQVEVRLQPALGAGRVNAVLAEDGQLVRYQLGLGWLEIELLADGSFSGRGVSGRLCP